MDVSTEDKLTAYEAGGGPEKKLVRDLVRKGHRAEVDLVLEIYHFFPSTRVVKNAPRLAPPASRD